MEILRIEGSKEQNMRNIAPGTDAGHPPQQLPVATSFLGFKRSRDFQTPYPVAQELQAQTSILSDLTYPMPLIPPLTTLWASFLFPPARDGGLSSHGDCPHSLEVCMVWDA